MLVNTRETTAKSASLLSCRSLSRLPFATQTSHHALLARTDLFPPDLLSARAKQALLSLSSKNPQRMRCFSFVSALTTTKVLPISSGNSPSRTGPSTFVRVWRDHPGIIILLMRSRHDSATLSIKSSWTLLWCIKLFSSSSRTAFGEGLLRCWLFNFSMNHSDHCGVNLYS